jgi:imidazolonepropionase-like amidohydrolase
MTQPTTTKANVPVLLRSARLIDVESGQVIAPASVLVEGERIVAVNPDSLPPQVEEIDLGDMTLLPGMMDMEVDLVLDVPPNYQILFAQEDPAQRLMRGVKNARITLEAGFTSVRNLGLFVRTQGIMLDVALRKAIDAGWIDGPRIHCCGHAITPTGGHLDASMFAAFAPGVLPLTVEEGVADGVDQVRRSVRYQIKHGADLIKVCATGGIMSHGTVAGAQQYSREELATVADEAHRAGLKVATHAHGDGGIRTAVEVGIDCIEHGSLMSDETMQLMIDKGTFLVPTTYLADALDPNVLPPDLRKKAEEVFPQAKRTIAKAIQRGVKIAVGTDAPAIPHGQNAKELVALVERGMSPLGAVQAATIRGAELLGVDDRGVIKPGLLADIIAVPGNPLDDIALTLDVRFVMKGGKVYKHQPG